jgi:hypothetical protein
MAIAFKPSEVVRPDAVVPSAEQLKIKNLERTLNELSENNIEAYRYLFSVPNENGHPVQVRPVLAGVLVRGGILIWSNPYGLTPQEVMAGLGSSGAKVFLIANKLGELAVLLGDPVPSIVPAEYEDKYVIDFATGVVSFK